MEWYLSMSQGNHDEYDMWAASSHDVPYRADRTLMLWSEGRFQLWPDIQSQWNTGVSGPLVIRLRDKAPRTETPQFMPNKRLQREKGIYMGWLNEGPKTFVEINKTVTSGFKQGGFHWQEEELSIFVIDSDMLRYLRGDGMSRARCVDKWNSVISSWIKLQGQDLDEYRPYKNCGGSAQFISLLEGSDTQEGW